MTSANYLLDTNILSDLIRHPQGVVAEQIAAVGEAAVCTSIVVAAELRFGAAKRNAPRLTDQVEAILAAMEVLPLAMPADRIYANLRSINQDYHARDATASCTAPTYTAWSSHGDWPWQG